MTNEPTKKPNRLRSLIIFGAIALIGAVVLLRLRSLHTADFFVNARGPISKATKQDGSWYWLEGVGKTGIRLARVGGRVEKDIANAEQITSYAVSSGKVAWISKDKTNWSVSIASVDGTGKQVVWSGTQEPHGVCIAENRLIWLQSVPALILDSGSLPPLTGTTQIVSVPITGGAPAVIATLLELNGKQIIGIQGGQVYAAAYRDAYPGVTAIYRAPLSGGNARRIVGETGDQSAILTKDGSLYWTAPSREATHYQTTVCIRRLGKDGKPETFTDWLPSLGKLYDSAHGIYYVDGSFLPSLWLVSGRTDLPRSIAMPENSEPLSVGDNEVLIHGKRSISNDSAVSRMSLP